MLFVIAQSAEKRCSSRPLYPESYRDVVVMQERSMSRDLKSFHTTLTDNCRKVAVIFRFLL